MASLTGGSDQVDSTRQLLDVGAALLTDFISERMQRSGDPEIMVSQDMLPERDVPDAIFKEAGQCFQKVGDQLDKDTQVQRMIAHPSLRPCKEVFIGVARQIFSDGKFNWGRVVMLFYFAYHLAKKAVMEKTPDIIRTIISWTIDFIRDHVISWIREQGGWDNIKTYFSTPKWRTMGAFLAGILTAVVVMNRI